MHRILEVLGVHAAGILQESATERRLRSEGLLQRLIAAQISKTAQPWHGGIPEDRKALHRLSADASLTIGLKESLPMRLRRVLEHLTEVLCHTPCGHLTRHVEDRIHRDLPAHGLRTRRPCRFGQCFRRHIITVRRLVSNRPFRHLFAPCIQDARRRQHDAHGEDHALMGIDAIGRRIHRPLRLEAGPTNHSKYFFRRMASCCRIHPLHEHAHHVRCDGFGAREEGLIIHIAMRAGIPTIHETRLRCRIDLAEQGVPYPPADALEKSRTCCGVPVCSCPHRCPPHPAHAACANRSR